MNFNPNPPKQKQEVIVSRKSKQINRLPLFFKCYLLNSTSTQKHVGMVSDAK